MVRNAKTQHGFRRAVRRGLANVSIQVYLTAAIMNLKRRKAFPCLFFICLEDEKRRRGDFGLRGLTFNRILLGWWKDFMVLKIAAQGRNLYYFFNSPNVPYYLLFSFVFLNLFFELVMFI
jgi:hypothetical protein